MKCICRKCHKIRKVCCSESVRAVRSGLPCYDGDVISADGTEVHTDPVCKSCCLEHKTKRTMAQSATNPH